MDLHSPRALLSSLAVVAVLSASLIAAGPAPVGAESSDPATGTPDRVVLNPTETPESSVMVTWRAESGLDDVRAEVRLPGTETLVGTFASDHDEQANGQPEAAHYSAELTGLTPATDYEYRVGGDAGWSDWATVRTASDGNEPFSFLYFGDAQNGLADYWPPVVARALADQPEARISLHEGDQINEADNDPEWGEWFRGLGDMARSKLTLTSPGNHEYSGDQFITGYRAHYEYPTNGPLLLRHEDVYYVDYQGVRFISLNANQQLGAPDQALWLTRVALLNNPMDWTVVFFHHPVFSASEGRDNPTLRAFWLPTFERLGIDLVLQGHDHTYARGHLTENETGPDTHEGPTYVVSVAGSKYYDLAPADDNVWTRNGATRRLAHEQTSTYQVIDVTEDQLTYRSVIGAKGEASTSDRDLGDYLDAFTVTRLEDGSKEVRDGLDATLDASAVGEPVVGEPVEVRLDVTGQQADGSSTAPTDGTVRVLDGPGDDATVLAEGAPGETLVLDEATEVGPRELVLRWSGDGLWRGGSAPLTVTVGRASADLVSPRHRLTDPRRGRRHGVVVVRSTNPAVDPTGAVVVRAGGVRVGTGVLGEAQRRLRIQVNRVPAGATAFNVKYRGDESVAPTRLAVPITD